MGVLSTQLSQLTNQELSSCLSQRRKLFPELEEARIHLQQLQYAAQTRPVLASARAILAQSTQIPVTSYTHYRLFRRSGERSAYQEAYFLKRSQLSASALLLFLGETEWKDMVQDLIWNICEESNWVVPAHEDKMIDLFAAETAFELTETLLLLGETLEEEIRHRVRVEVERRVFDPYLRFYHLQDWYLRGSNWNGVCNSAVAAAFLLLEEEPGRLKRALEIALTGLDAFLDTAFAEDGSSSEGVSYWQYGLLNFIPLAEFLYTLSDGAIDLLATEKLKRIAAFPLKLQLSGSSFASFSDCEESVHFHPGLLARLAKRTGEDALLSLLADGVALENDWRLPMMLRNILWWDGSRSAAVPPDNTYLPAGGTARLVTRMAAEWPFVLSVKAGHNDEEHNHNDIGSFLLHVAGENVLTDPGRGRYTRDYFRAGRYENIFANSYGHSVPRIDGKLQGTGRAFAGTFVEVPEEGATDRPAQVTLEFAAAYDCPDLTSARRELRLSTENDGAGTLRLHDTFTFAEQMHEVEEAFITWLECEVEGATATIYGQHTVTSLTIEQGAGLNFQLERLEKQSENNQKPGVLKRLSITLPRGKMIEATVYITVREKRETAESVSV